MRDADHLNMLAVLADADARSTATLVEVLAATVLAKLAPPEGDAIAELEISQADLSEVAQEFVWLCAYDEDGTMHMKLTRKVESLIAAQPDEGAEVTSDAAE